AERVPTALDGLPQQFECDGRKLGGLDVVRGVVSVDGPLGLSCLSWVLRHKQTGFYLRNGPLAEGSKRFRNNSGPSARFIPAEPASSRPGLSRPRQQSRSADKHSRSCGPSASWPRTEEHQHVRDSVRQSASSHERDDQGSPPFRKRLARLPGN